MTTYTARKATHTVAVTVTNADLVPVPFAEPGTRMIVTRVRAEWVQYGTDPWKLDVVTEHGVSTTGDPVTADWWPANPSKRPPARLSEWLATTHPARERTSA